MTKLQNRGRPDLLVCGNCNGGDHDECDVMNTQGCLCREGRHERVRVS
jgi:hypothetical protein